MVTLLSHCFLQCPFVKSRACSARAIHLCTVDEAHASSHEICSSRYAQFIFLPLSSLLWQATPRIEPAFWADLGEIKLKFLRLDDGPIRFSAPFTSSNVIRTTTMSGYLSLEKEMLPKVDDSQCSDAQIDLLSFGMGDQGPSAGCLAEVVLYSLNSVDDVESFDMSEAMQKAANEVWESIMDGRAMGQQSSLQPVIAATYCDLKAYKYYYRFAYPLVQPPMPFEMAADSAVSASQHFSAAVLEAVARTLRANKVPSRKSPQVQLLNIPMSSVHSSEEVPLTATLTNLWELKDSDSLSSGTQALEDSAQANKYCSPYLVVVDPSPSPTKPGQVLNNILLLAAFYLRASKVRVLCVRAARGLFDPKSSLVIEVNLPRIPEDFRPRVLSISGDDGSSHCVDISRQFDPEKRSMEAVALNLQLMKWRAAPTVDLDLVSSAKCLILGAGTLGCNVARNLLGWGVLHVTFIDNSRVSYSNPVRQSLFTHEDCLDGGRPKAVAAAEALQRIFPGVQAEGRTLEIPMPGHRPMSEIDAEEVKRHSDTLDGLVQSHDVVFLLLDTREARWAPTLMCAAHNKIAVTSALGFDSLMVMRHGEGVPLKSSHLQPSIERSKAPEEKAGMSLEAGVGHEVKNLAVARPPSHEEMHHMTHDKLSRDSASQRYASGLGDSSRGHRPRTPRLSCYFCQDIIAPRNSTVGRAMDQQCTVARPGLSPIAGSLAVELMVAILQHPDGISAPAAGTNSTQSFKHSAEALHHANAHEALPLGPVPHMIRANLHGFSQICLYGEAYEKCSACSGAVVEAYRNRGSDFVYDVLMQPEYLERLCGLDELYRQGEMIVSGTTGAVDLNQCHPEGVGTAPHAKNDEEDELWEAL